MMRIKHRVMAALAAAALVSAGADAEAKNDVGEPGLSLRTKPDDRPRVHAPRLIRNASATARIAARLHRRVRPDCKKSKV